MESISQFLLTYGFPAAYLWAVPIALVAMGLIFVFGGAKAWKATVFLSGLAAGYILTFKYISPLTTLPSYLLPLAAGIILGIVLSFVVRFGISAGIGFIAYDIAKTQTFHSFGTVTSLHIHALPIAIGFVAMGIAYYFYRKISMLIASLLGALAIYFGLVLYIPEIAAVGAGIIMMAIGLYSQLHKNKPHFKRKKKGADNATQVGDL